MTHLDPVLDLDTLISIAGLQMNTIRPHNPSTSAAEDAGTEPNLGAFCYIFSILLNVSSKKAITKRKEQLHTLTSTILELLERESADFISTATRTTVGPYLWCAFPMISRYKCKEAISENLLRKLDELSSAVEEKFQRVLFILSTYEVLLTNML